MSNKAASQFSAPVLYGIGLVALALVILTGLTMAGGQHADRQPELAQAEVAVAGDTRPVFALTADDIDIWISRTQLFTADRRTDMRNGDSLTGGESVMIFHDLGALHYYTMPQGRVWRIRQLSGKVSACGSPDIGVRAATEMASIFALVDLTAEQKAAIRNALAGDKFYDANLGIAKLGIAGGCVDKITLTAL